MKKILFLLITLGITACTGNVQDDDGAQVGSVSGDDGTSGAALSGSVSYDRNAINDPGSVLANRTIYFDYDSSNIRDDYAELVKHHGKYLSINSGVDVRLEGHTDERGTREYNVALADRRAQAVKRLLSFEGASSNQATVISYGEEKPAQLGHDEQAWRLNRRVVIVYGE